MQNSKPVLPAESQTNIADAARSETKLKYILRTVWSDSAFKSALFAFSLTRLIILFIFISAAHFEILPGTLPTDGSRQPHIVIHRDTILPKLEALGTRGDGNWYLGIARHGYERRAFDDSTQHNWAFFPLYPLLLWSVAQLTGEFVLTGMALSSFLFLLALILLHKTVTAFGYDESLADRSVFYLAAFPTSYFFSLPLTESLFLLLVIASFYATRRNCWWTAGVVGSLASATRITGIMLLPALCVQYWRQRSDNRNASILKLFLIPLGLLGFMYFLNRITGDPLAFKNIQGSWSRHPGFFLYPLLSFLQKPNEIGLPWDLRIINFSAAVLGLMSGVVLLKKREWGLAIYTLACVIVALSSQLLQSQARYTMVVFPVFIVLAMWGRVERLDQALRAVLLVLLALMSALYAAHVSAAMA